jgi:AAA domain
MATNADVSPAQPSAVVLPELTPQKLLSLGVLSPRQVDRICADEGQAPFLVEGLLPTRSIAIAAGDSTIGKSPLVLQLALSVAGGVPLLGMPTTQGRVLYFDLENPLSDCKSMRDALAQFLGLSEMPDDFLLVTEPKELEHLIEEVKPQLLVIDSVRAFRPDVTEGNRATGEWLKTIRCLARKYGCAFLLVHHVKKPARTRDGALLEPDLQSLPVVTWMQEMEGPRAFVNQTDIRIAIARGTSNGAALDVKWSRRVHGDSPLLLLERVFDGDGEPIGYRSLTGVALLSSQRREALEKLPNDFSFKEAKAALGRADDPTNKFLRAVMQADVVKKIGRGRYRKITPVEGNAARVTGAAE